MNNNNFQLIRPEQIFDLPTAQLEQSLTQINKHINNNPNIQPQQRQKIDQIIQLIEEEINQRQLLHQFQKLCSKYEDKDQKIDNPQNKQFIQKLDNFNAQFQELVNQMEKQEKEKQNIKTKLSLPEENKQGNDVKRSTNTSMRLSKIKKADINQNQNQKDKDKQKQKYKQQEKQKEKQTKIITKPKSVTKSSRISNKTASNTVQTTNVKKQKQSSKIGTKTSIQTNKTQPVSETKLKLVSTKKPPAKKVSKKQANDWLVQLVRQQQQKRQRQIQKNNLIRSSVLIQNKQFKLQKQKINIQQNKNIVQSKSKQLTKLEQQKQNYNSIQTTQSSVFIKQQPTNQNTQTKTLIVNPSQTVSKKEIIITQQQKVQVKKQEKINKIKQEIESLKEQQTQILKQKQQIQEFKIKNNTDNIQIKSQEGLKQPNQKQTKSIEDKQLIQYPSIPQVIKFNDTQLINQQSVPTQISKEAQTKIHIQSNPPIHQINQYNIISNNNFKIDKIQQSDNQSDESDQQRNIKSKQLQLLKSKQKMDSKNNKACFSEEYWERVRKQAFVNLERVKLMKQLRQNQKQHLLNQMQIADLHLQPEIQNITINKQVEQNKQNQQIIIQEQQIPIVQTPVKEAPKINIKKNTQKKKLPQNPKKPQAIPIKLPEIIPNYLDLFPTFNHLFSVYYNKPHNQAVLDIQTLMKQLISINNNHLVSLTHNQTYKRPMFRSFDNTCVYVNDAHQLLLNAQTTNIDLKVLLNRLNIFNENLHGRFEQKPEDTLYYRVVKSREQVYDIITTAFLRTTKWQQLPHGMNLKTSWNLLWSWAKPEVDFNKLLVFQKVNHYPQNKNLSRKDLLYKNLDNFKKITKTSIGFVPLTFNLPKEYSAFSAKFHEDQSLQGSMNIWIMKPIGKSRGRGIKLINNLADLNYLDSIVVQKYLKNPLLLDGYKFDLRVYVLVTSIHPLEVFVYKEGFARLSTQKYVLDPHSLKNTFIHLTNFSIQRNNKQAQNATNDGGSKITFKVLRQKLQQQNIKWSGIWQKIHQIIIKSLLACSLSMPACPSAFQLFGYDVIIDTDQNVHLIEVNASPSLQRSYLIDQIVKQSLIDDIMDLVDFPNFDRQQCVNVMNERLQRKSNNPYNSIQDNIDIGRILKWKPLRKVGQMPSKLGLFQRVAPQERSSNLQKIINTKYNPNIKFADVWN